MEIHETSEAISIFDEFESHLVLASQGKRLANYIIDQVAFLALFVLLLIPVLMFFPDFFSDDDSAVSKLRDRIVAMVLYALFMGAAEAIFKGKSLGKLITGTRAVNEDGSTISAATAFKRGFSRAVPFCAFSALGNPSYPWQDRWTNTYVIDEKQSQMNKTEQY